MLHALMLESRN